MVSFKDYDGIEGFGSASASEVADLNKALTVGQDINNPGASAGEGFPYRVESLENTLKVTTWKMKEIKFWKAIPKIPAYNTVEEHNTISSYGTNTDSVWIDEGDLPEEESATVARNYAVVKYMGSTRKVSHVATMIKPAHGNLVAQETVNGTMHLLRSTEEALFYGDSSLSALQYDGIYKLINDNAAAANIVDLRGQALSEDALQDACTTIQENYGAATDLYLNPRAFSQLTKTFFPKERHNTINQETGVIGLGINGFMGPTGVVNFQSDVFLLGNTRSYNAAALGDSTKRPGTPTISTALAAAGTSSPLWTADDAGDYFYTVVACNRYGKSAPVECNAAAAALTVAATQTVTVGVTPSSATTAWYEWYRTEKNGANGTDKLIQRTANAAGAGETTLTDNNSSLPNTTDSFLIQNNTESLSFKQLAPMIKIPLATIDTAIRWAQVLYGVPVMYAYNRNVIFKNCGQPS